MKSFGEKLKGARQAAGMTQASLAERSGIPLGTIREWEQSKREPLFSKAGRLARALSVPMESLLPDDEPGNQGKAAKVKGAGGKRGKR
jgi:transcriptional regulator with XRE-family HTH domain